ncbi:MAG: hypothetical protein GY820_17385, partial [Gammaproteobacteria bacterium]|nr:hypothetical protein [Gammaproteobacteria bacterium]
MRQDRPDAVYEDILGTREQVSRKMKILPSSLQFAEIAVTGEFTEIPDELVHKVRFRASVADKGETLFDITVGTYRVSNRPVVLVYEPETAEDHEIINSYGGIGNTPSYMIRMRPVLKINGERAAVGRDGLPMGGEYDLDVELISPNGTERITNTHIAGNMCVMGIVSQRAVMPEQIPDEEKNAERILFEEALSYTEQWNLAEDELASLLRLAPVRPVPSVVTMGGIIDVTWLSDAPHGFERKGVFADADLRRIEVAEGPGSVSSAGKIFMQISALQGSVLEHRIFEDDFRVKSISTSKLFGLAHSRRIPVLTVDSGNIGTVLPELNVAENIRDDIADAV